MAIFNSYVSLPEGRVNAELDMIRVDEIGTSYRKNVKILGGFRVPTAENP